MQTVYCYEMRTIYLVHMCVFNSFSSTFKFLFQEVNSDRTVWHKPQWNKVLMVWPTFIEGGEEMSDLRDSPGTELSCTGNGVVPTGYPEFLA